MLLFEDGVQYWILVFHIDWPRLPEALKFVFCINNNDFVVISICDVEYLRFRHYSLFGEVIGGSNVAFDTALSILCIRTCQKGKQRAKGYTEMNNAYGNRVTGFPFRYSMVTSFQTRPESRNLMVWWSYRSTKVDSFS